MTRGLILLSALVLLATGAFFFHHVRYGDDVRAADTAPALPGTSKDLVLEIGGGAAALAASAPAVVSPPTVVEETPAPAPAPETPPENKGDSLRMAKGDSLYAIAKRYYGSGSPAVVKELAAANKIADPGKIREGFEIKLPATAGGKKRI